MATYYMAGGETIPLLPPFNAGFCKRELQGLVEGEFDTIALRDGTLLIINAEAYGIAASSKTPGLRATRSTSRLRNVKRKRKTR